MIFLDSDRGAFERKAAQVAWVLGSRPSKAVPAVPLPFMPGAELEHM